MDLMELIAGLQQQASMGNPGMGMPDAESPSGLMLPPQQPDPVAPPMADAGLSDATDISARARAPLSIPLPRPRPDGAPMGDPSAAMAFAGAPAQRQGGLLSAIAPDLVPSQPTMNKAFAALGGGLSTISGNTKGGTFARAMGGGLKSGTDFDKNEFDRGLKALKALQEAKANGTSEEYKAALTRYYKVLTDQKSQQAAVTGTAPAKTKGAIKPPAKPGTEISMQGDGTQSSPYAPNSKDDYDGIESGTYYIHPGTGKVMLKK